MNDIVSVLPVALALIALLIGVIGLFRSRAQDLTSWAISALAVAFLL